MSGPQACGCHIYSGGFTTGLIQSGFDVVAQWEEIQAGAATFELNFPHIEHPTDRADWNPEKIKGIELFYGNPPCAPWSAAGAQLGLRDPRMQYTVNVMETGLAVEPEFFILESVCRAWSKPEGKAYYTDWARKWMEKGYGVTVVLTNALLHGAPQSRERFHFIAHRMDLALQEPRVLPTDVMTVGQCIGDLADTAGLTDDKNHYLPYPMTDRALNVIARLNQGDGWNIGYDRAIKDGVDAVKGRFISHRFHWDTPGATLLDISAVVHPVRPRVFTLREGARLCGYPDWFKFYATAGNPTGFGTDVTQAVIPYMGQHWGKAITHALDVARPLDPNRPAEVEVIDWRPLGKKYFPRCFEKTLADFNAGLPIG